MKTPHANMVRAVELNAWDIGQNNPAKQSSIQLWEAANKLGELVEQIEANLNLGALTIPDDCDMVLEHAADLISELRQIATATNRGVMLDVS